MPAPTRRYASPAIAERRQRLIDETLRLIAETGMTDFTLKQLAQRAGVSVNTIYNIFGDKPGVLVHAVRTFEGSIRLTLPGRATDLAGFLDAIAETTRVVRANRAYALALAELYAARGLSDELYGVIRNLPLAVFGAWLWLARRDRMLGGWLTPNRAAQAFANLDWAVIRDWGAGRVADADLCAIRQQGFLTIVAAAAAAPVRAAAAALAPGAGADASDIVPDDAGTRHAGTPAFTNREHGRADAD